MKEYYSHKIHILLFKNFHKNILRKFCQHAPRLADEIVNLS
jgi:hypothetical protein